MRLAVEPDIVELVADELSKTRRRLAALVDQAEAVAELYSRSVALQAERRDVVTFDGLLDSVRGEQARAELTALLSRALCNRPGRRRGGRRAAPSLIGTC